MKPAPAVIVIVLVILLAVCVGVLSCTLLNTSTKSDPVEGYVTKKISIPAMHVPEEEPAKYILSLERYDEAGNVIYSTSLRVEQETFDKYEVGDYYKYSKGD